MNSFLFDKEKTQDIVFFHRLNFILLLAIAGLFFVISSNVVASEKEVHDIGSRRELFVDDYLIDQLNGKATQRLHHPVPREIVIKHEEDWEGTGCGYHNVFKDGDIYRMYYNARNLDLSHKKLDTGRHPFYCGYAESKDGIHWTKPDLGIYEYKGSKKNNIFLFPEQFANLTIDPGHVSVFKDENPDCPPESQYKAFVLCWKLHGLLALQSADGIHWSLMSDKPVLTAGAFDSQNLAFWDPVRKEYRAYWRTFSGLNTWKPGRVRAIRTATSKDFIHWGPHTDLTYVNSPAEELYTNQIKPYHRAPHLFIGLPVRYVDRGWSESMKKLPEYEDRKMRSSVSERYGTGLTETLIMMSRNGSHFKRWNEAFIPPGIERDGTWQYGHHFVAWHLVETKSSLEGNAPNELSLYSTERGWKGKGSCLRRHSIRMDGFVSINGPREGGELITKPFQFTGNELSFNFSSSAVGGIKVEIQDEDGTPVSGYRLEDCDVLFGNSIDRKVTWKRKSDVSSISRKNIRLRITLDDADLYSIKFD